MVMKKGLKLVMPYKFKGIHMDFMVLKKERIRFLSRDKVAFYIDSDIFQSFDNIFDNVLSALAEKDLDYLSQIMENRLFNATKESLERIEMQTLKLKYVKNELTEGTSEEVNEEEEAEEAEDPSISRQKKREEVLSMFQQSKEKFRDPELFAKTFPYVYRKKDLKINVEASGVFGADLDREKNSDKRLFKIYLPGTKRTVFLNLTSVFDVYHKQILVLNVFYLTNRRLCLIDEDGDLVEGDEDLTKFYHHKWRFETRVPDMDWVLTDMDDYLKGNPYNIK
jgi:CRISPR/Cas system CMR-associated protein Cmr5 small subunit